jgi:hypothetical protein
MLKYNNYYILTEKNKKDSGLVVHPICNDGYIETKNQILLEFNSVFIMSNDHKLIYTGENLDDNIYIGITCFNDRILRDGFVFLLAPDYNYKYYASISSIQRLEFLINEKFLSIL